MTNAMSNFENNNAPSTVDPKFTFTDWDNFNPSQWYAIRKDCHNFGDITVIENSSNPMCKLFIAKELADIFGYNKPDHLTQILDSENVRLLLGKTLSKIKDLGDSFAIQGRSISPQGMKLVNYAGFNYAIMHSKKPNAKIIQSYVYKNHCNIIVVGEKLKRTALMLEKVDYNPNNKFIFAENNNIYTTSNIISDFFGVRHTDLLRSIDNSINMLLNSVDNIDNSVIDNLNDKGCISVPNSEIDRRAAASVDPYDKLLYSQIEKFVQENFIRSAYIDSNNRNRRQYKLTEKGFNYIALGLNSKNASIYRMMFIEEFHRMRETIKNRIKSTMLRNVFPTYNNNSQYVYVIKNPMSNAIKIGISNDVGKRLKTLQTGAGCELELVYQSMLCTNAFEIESSVHKRYKDNLVFGEWYNIHDTNELISYIENSIVRLNSNFKELTDQCDSVIPFK